MAMLVVHHNTFFNLSDHLTPYINNEMKGSGAAEHFLCGRTKTSAIVNCVGDQFQLDVMADLKNLSFILMLDGSNDTWALKMFPVTVRIFDINYQRIIIKKFYMYLMEGRDASTAAEMFSSVDKLFIKHVISQNFVIALGVDNTNTNIENIIPLKVEHQRKTITYLLLDILHYAAYKSGSAFATVTGFDIEDHCVDLFYQFDKSSKRKSILKEYYEFCNSECEEFIKYVLTRWLCLKRCVNRVLKKHAGLKYYFL